MTAESSRPEPKLSSASLAKVNLTLRVTDRRADGYHLLDSLVVFPAIGDFVEVEPARGLNLSLDGPQGYALDAGPENLALRAAIALREAFQLSDDCGASIRLEKRLPIASGIGGGSANAATVLRLLAALWRLDASNARLEEIGLSLGADVPVCLGAPRARLMRGIGDELSPAPELPTFWLVLINPGVGVPTGEVFRRLSGSFSDRPPAPPARFQDFRALQEWLAATGNDLEPPAIALAPEIGAVLSALQAAPACALARMSGSGATCFGLFEDGDAALAAAEAIRTEHPAWWVASGPVDRV